MKKLLITLSASAMLLAAPVAVFGNAEYMPINAFFNDSWSSEGGGGNFLLVPIPTPPIPCGGGLQLPSMRN